MSISLTFKGPGAWLYGVLALALAGSAGGQTREILVDFGEPTSTTGQRGEAWNDVHTGNVTGTHALVDTSGTPSGIQLDFTPGLTFTSANSGGVQSPAAGSALQQLSWPASALRDTFYGSSGAPVIELFLSNLDAGATYDLVVVASRLNVSDVRTARYTADGQVSASAVLDAANNVSEYVTIAGLAPDGSGRIRLEIRADASNTNPNGYFYFNALGIREYAGGSQGALIAFTSNQIDFSRVIGKGAFASETSVYTNNGSAPSLSLIGVDDSTGLAPTWLSVPGVANAASPIPLSVDADGLAPGNYSASLYANASGYPETSTSIRLAVRPQGGFLNLLYYGNSYSQGNGTVGALVQALAEEAGFEPPRTVQRLVGGQKLSFHLNEPSQAVAITQSLPLGEEWDFVIMQGFSLEATATLGNPAQFVADSVAILGNVKAHSPGARAVLFQTWARGPGHSVYPGSFPGPLQMHQQIENGYRQAEAAIDSAFGPGSARRAAAGETAALRNFHPGLYIADLSHPAPPLSVMAFSAIYSAIYGARACDVSPDFGAPSNLASRLIGFGIGAVDWYELAGIADRVATPATRRRPGSGEDFLLSTGAPGILNACPLKSIAVGESVTFQVHSPIGTYAGLPATILFDDLRDGPTLEIGVSQTNPLTAHVVAQTSALPPQGISVTLTIPPAFAGRSFLVQGQVLGPSPKTLLAFTTTDGHLLLVSP